MNRQEDKTEEIWLKWRAVVRTAVQGLRGWTKSRLPRLGREIKIMALRYLWLPWGWPIGPESESVGGDQFKQPGSRQRSGDRFSGRLDLQRCMDKKISEIIFR